MSDDLYVWQLPDEAFSGNSSYEIVGRKYHDNAIVLDWRWYDDDHLQFLLVEEEDEEKPFVIIRVHADAKDQREDITRDDTIRYAMISWENY